MARPLRIQYPGAVYHVMCRGNERREIFRSDDDRRAFLDFLAHSLGIYSLTLHAYVLMTDHFHLLVETPLANLAEFMRHFNITYTGFFNRQHKRVGHLYQGRYKSILVEKESYLSVVSRYLHLNPVRLKSLEKNSVKERFDILCRFPWSSLPGYLDLEGRQSMVDYSLVLADFGGETEQARNGYRKQILLDLADDLDLQDKVVAQSILGGENFIRRVQREILPTGSNRERPAARLVKQYRQKDTILAAIEKETGRDLAALKREKGDLRRVAMDLLYRHAGLKGTAIGAIFGVEYSAVSQERKRLRGRLPHDAEFRDLVRRLEDRLSTMKI